MNEELKKYVNAFMDGEEVEWRYETQDTSSMWYIVFWLSDFESDTKHSGIKHYRIKPKAEDKWQRVIDEEYYCKFWNDECYESAEIGYLEIFGVAYKRADGHFYDNCEVLREKGIKQPYFQGDKTPHITGAVIIYTANGQHEYVADGFVNWLDVVAYIEV